MQRFLAWTSLLSLVLALAFWTVADSGGSIERPEAALMMFVPFALAAWVVTSLLLSVFVAFRIDYKV